MTESVEDVTSVRGQLGIECPRQLGDVDERHRAARATFLVVRLRAQRGAEQRGRRSSENPRAQTHASAYIAYNGSVVDFGSFLSSAGAFSHVYARRVAYRSNHSTSAFILYKLCR